MRRLQQHVCQEDEFAKVEYSHELELYLETRSPAFKTILADDKKRLIVGVIANMNVDPSIELNKISPSFDQFEAAHREEITALSLLVAKMTSCSVEEVKLRLNIMLSELVKVETPLFNSQQWEADMNLLAEGADTIPILPDEAFTRESIYSNHN
jgi:hypothetical protein